MPIKPQNRLRYPSNWSDIRKSILERARHRRKGSPAYPDCRAHNGYPHPVTGSKVVLTVAHLDHQPENNDRSNLRAWCQRCHLTYDARHHAENAKLTRQQNKRISMPTESEKMIEQELKDRGLNAPRLTPEKVDAAIVSETFTVLPSGKCIVCEITLKNGFTVRGDSAVVSKANFKQDIGEKISRENARKKVWELEAYLLQQELWIAEQG